MAVIVRVAGFPTDYMIPVATLRKVDDSSRRLKITKRYEDLRDRLAAGDRRRIRTAPAGTSAAPY